MIEDWQHGGFGIYIHWPFCEAKCPYCDFNSYVEKFIDQDRWRKAYLKELERCAKLTPGRVVNSVFFGGGTPSLMDPKTITDVLDAVADHWTLANNIEITLEANPSSVEAGRFTDYASAGINRVSLGVQALNDTDLQRLGRLHSVKEAYAALDIANSTFDRVSFDLIYARQNQSLSDWELELKQALTKANGHLSLYQLTIEDGTAFGNRYKRGKLSGLPQDDTSADMYDLTNDVCEAHGLHRYEVSNHAALGQESHHNLIYWNYGDYIGIGPGAHGRVSVPGIGRTATETHLAPGKWLNEAEAGNGESLTENLTGSDQATEYLLMGLRLKSGIDPKRFAKLAGKDLRTSTLTDLAQNGLLTHSEENISLTNQGLAVLNAVAEQLLRD